MAIIGDRTESNWIDESIRPKAAIPQKICTNCNILNILIIGAARPDKLVKFNYYCVNCKQFLCSYEAK